MKLWQDWGNTAKNRGRRRLVRHVHEPFFRHGRHSRCFRNSSWLRNTILKLFNNDELLLQGNSGRTQKRSRQHRGACGRDARTVQKWEGIALVGRRRRCLFVGPLPAETMERRHCRLKRVTAQRVEVVIWLFLGTAAVLRCRERKGLRCGHHITACVCPDRTTLSQFVTRRCGACKKQLLKKKGWKVPSAPKKKEREEERETGVVEKMDYDAKMQGNQQKVHQKRTEKQDSVGFNAIGQAGMAVEDTHSFLDSTNATTVMGS